MTQAELAQAAGMTQNNLSRLESPDYGKHTLSSLRRIAAALDVALVVRLVPFSQYIDWLSGTPHLDRGLRPEALAVSGYEDEEARCAYEANIKYYPVYCQSPSVASGTTPAVTGTYAGQFNGPTIKVGPMSPVSIGGAYESVLLPALRRKVV